MKISHINIRDVRGVKSMDFKPATINYITGPSGSGKSSVMDAIRYGITGKSGEDHVRLGSLGGAQVSVLFDRIGSVTRSISDAGKTKITMNGKGTTGKSVTEQMQAVYGVSMDSLNLMTSSELLSHALGKDLAAYLLNGGFLTHSLTMSGLLILNPMDAPVEEELKKYLPENPVPISLSDIENAYKSMMARRPVLKSMLAEAKAKAAVSVDTPKRSSDDIQKEITSLSKKIAAEESLTSGYPKYLQEVEKLKQNIAESEAKLKEYDGVKPVSEREQELAKKNLQAANERVTDIGTNIKIAKDDIASLEKTLTALDTSVCPISKQLICKTDKTPVHAELSASLQMKYDLAATLETKLEDAKKARDNADAIIRELAQQQAKWQMRVAIIAELGKLKDIKIPEIKAPTEGLLASMTAAQAKLQEELVQARTYEAAAVYAEQATKLTDDLNITETLVKELAPNGGIRKLILSNSIAPLEAWCNDQLASVLPKYQLHFAADDNFNVVMETSAGETLQFTSLSSGEQLRVIFVLMCMLNELNGVRIIMLDNLNALDSDSRKNLLSLMVSLSDKYDHLFISGIGQNDFANDVKSCGVAAEVIDMSTAKA